MIEVVGLSRDFGNARVLSGLDFRVGPGEIVGFLGPNGAGKTTTMRILTCTLPPSAGTARIAGHDVVDASEAVRRKVGYMPENAPLPPDATVMELLRFVARLKGVPEAGLREHLEEIVATTGLADVRERVVGHLSKGYRQRAALAQALVGDPEVLILDEPTSGLDPHQIVEIRHLIRGFAGRKTILLSSHILAEVSATCERVLILDRGRLVSGEGLPADGVPGEDLEKLFLRLTGHPGGGGS
jgi:ABC-2 type transport system ATP-binding protein